MPSLIDTHCHLDFPEFDEDRGRILAKCREQHLSAIVVPGICRKDWQQLLNLCHCETMLHPALGLHPCFLNEHQRSDLDKLAALCEHQSLCAVGEIGLDYYFKNRDFKNTDTFSSSEKELHKEQQKLFFSEQLHIAKQYHLPVLIHALKSHQDVLQVLKTIQSEAGGVIHAFSGSYEQAKEYLKLGFKLGFGGAFTYPKATRLRALVTKLPLEAWVLETDAPDMTPVKHYGERNSPEYLGEIAQEFIKLFPIKKDSATIIKQLQKNTLDVISIN